MTDGPYHSIGEVLSLLKEEHEDLTISKIRFLESQGLIEPERTPSGYRRFYDTDIDRLRWILSQQRDNFMPLKMIKRHLETEGFDPAAEIGERPMPELLPEPSLFSEREMSGSLEAAEAERTATEATVETEPAASQAAAGAAATPLNRHLGLLPHGRFGGKRPKSGRFQLGVGRACAGRWASTRWLAAF